MTNPRSRNPAGFEIGDVWGWALRADPNSATGEAVKYFYQNGGAGGGKMSTRLMFKLEEIFNKPQRHAQAVSMVERAQSYGLPVMLTVDWFNSADSRNDYHKYTWFPQDGVAKVVRDVLREFRPESLEVCNEFWHTKGPKDMRMTEYSALVLEYLEGMQMANWNGTLVASINLDPRDQAEDLWVWDIPYADCQEAVHTLILSNGPDNPQDLKRELESSPWAKRGKAIGWVFPINTNETSYTNNSADMDTENGAEMAVVTLDHYSRFKTPFYFLVVGGAEPPEHGGQWGMRVWCVNHRGEFSMAAEEHLRWVGSEVPDFDEPEDPDDSEPPGTTGRGRLLKGIRFAKRADRGKGKIIHVGRAKKAVKRIERAIEIAKDNR